VAIFFDASENWTASNNGTQIRFANTPNGSTTRTDRLLLTNTGNLLLQNGGTFTDSGERLQVTGTMKVTGDVNFGGASGLTFNSTLSKLAIGTAYNHINLSITSSLGGLANPAAVYVASAVASSATGSATYFYSAASVSNASFTLPHLYHFRAVNGGIGASATVTNQYAFIAESSLTGATNNYGFYGDIASGTNRWNLYMNGTANNYLAGNLAIGSTSSTTDWLNIAASTTAKAHIYLAAGVAPTSPANGDIWFDGTDIKMRIGGVTKTFTLV
jgi:hypothetical protein